MYRSQDGSMNRNHLACLATVLALSVVSSALQAADAKPADPKADAKSAKPAESAYTVPEKAAALDAVKATLTEAAKSGKKISLMVNIAGWVKADLASVDEKAVTVNFEGNPFSLKWDKIPVDQIPQLIKSSLQENPKRALVGMDFCLANDLLDKAEDFMTLASANSKELGPDLKVRIKALSEKRDAIRAAANPAPVVASSSGKDKDGDPVAYKAPEKIAFRASEYGNLTPIKDVSAAVDNAIEIALAEMGVHPEPVCDDSAFLRRAFLDVTGQIPTPEDLMKFYSEGGGPAKRAKAIDELIKRPEYADRWANFWTVLLIGRRTREEADAKPHFFRSWMREQFARNEKFDRVVTSILTATGENDKDGAASYLTFKLSDTLPITVGHISQTFLGARIACAQCHDHPFDKWTQQDFWGFCSFMANTRSERKELREDPKDPMKVTRQWHVLIDSDTRNGGQRYEAPQRELTDLPAKVLDGPIFNSGSAPSRPLSRKVEKKADKDKSMSDDKSMADNKSMTDKSMASKDKKMDKSMSSSGMMDKESMAEMMSMDDASMMSAAAGGSGSRGLLMRKAFAAWVTSPKNEKFAQSAVNRVWRDLFGIGLVEPVDDIRPKNPPIYPEVMKIVSEDFNASGRDLQRMLAVIMNTKAYQRSSIGMLKNSDRVKQVRYFARAEVRPMTPESLFLAVIKATAGEEKVKSIVEGQRKQDESYAYGAKMGGMNADLGEVTQLMNRFIGTSTAEDRAGKLQFEGTVSQALMMMHSGFMQNYIKMGVKRFRGDMTWLFASTLGRPPTPEESNAFGSMMADPEGMLWVLLNSAEFISIH